MKKTSISIAKRAAMMLLLAVCTTMAAWADPSIYGGGDGSAKNPLIISSEAHWNQLATDVNGGTTYNGMYFKLDADITVTTMVGQGTNRFRGIFDGDGHTITVNYTGITEDYCAPFCRISGATIKNLHTAGTIETSGCYASGIVAYTRYYSRIENCRSSVTIRSSHAGWGGHGGILALKAWVTQSEPVIEGCVFDGKILTTGTTEETKTIGCGGIVGFTNGQTLTLKNSIYKPAALETGETAVACPSLYENSSGKPSTVTCTNCYYFQTFGNAQGKQAHSINIYEGVTIVPTGNATTYNVSGITGYEGNSCVKYNGTVYAGDEDVVTLKFNHNYEGCTLQYSVGGIPLSGDDTDGYTLNMPNEDVNIAYTMSTYPTAQFSGSGTSDSPYLIGNASEWDLFVYYVNEGITQYSTAFYRLTDDIEVTTMVGTDSHRFGGHFDGGIYDGDHNLTGYHKLTVNYATDEQYVAPFRYVDGAVISNLRVAGTINTSNKFAGGFIANAKGSTSITNCRSSVTINSSVYGDGTHGGFVAHNTGGTLTFTGCAFDGQMMGSGTNCCAGFVGWNETNDNANGKVSITNSLFAPTSTQQIIEKVFVRSRSYADGVITINNSHCTAHYNVEQQSRVYSITTDNYVTMATTQPAEKTYSVSGITIYNVGLTFNGVLYTKTNDQLPLTLEHSNLSGYTFTGFTSTAGTLTHGEGNSYTLTMGNANATINANYAATPVTWGGTGDGSEQDPYEIESIERWDELVNKVSNDKVNSNNVPFANAYYKLTANITVTTMVGTEDHKFMGHFDGDGKTLTLSYSTSNEPVNKDYCAPFRYIEGADIHDLTVAGTIYTNKQFAAGIAGYALNNNTITNCRSSVVINSNVNGDGTHGGFVANCQNNTDDDTFVTFTNCAFDGQLLGTATNNCGGFVGWTEDDNWAGTKFINCIFAPSQVSVQSDGSSTFARTHYNSSEYIIVSNSYYTQHLGTRQGEMAYATQPTDVVTEPLTIAGVTIYVEKTVVTDIAATNITPTTATINWTGSEGCSNYQVRYRLKPDTEIYYTSFEDGLPEGWTTFDNDDDNEHNWTYYGDSDDSMPHSGSGCVYSASYLKNIGALQPDNWLVSKQLTLGGLMKVWLRGQDGGDYREHFAIYLSTTGGSKTDYLDGSGNLKSGVITLVPETETTHEYQEYTANLSAYSGQTGYIAIRHFNCYDQFYLVADDFGLYNNNPVDEWTTVPVSPSGAGGVTLTGLTAGTTYEYQVGYQYGGNTYYYTPTAVLTTQPADIAPTNLTATCTTATTATVSWTGYGDSYNLRYGKGGQAKVTLSVPNDIWGDGSGYQMLLDANHTAYGDVIPETGGLTSSGDASTDTYANFEYKIPENADGKLETTNVLDGSNGKKTVDITIPAGIYDWCITNPSPGDRMWIASGNGDVGGRQNDFVFEAGKHYTFTITYDGSVDNDRVDRTVEDDAELVPGSMTSVDGITTKSCNLTDLTASAFYTVYVQSVKDNKFSEWSSVNFTTTVEEGEINLYDDLDNSGIIAANNGQNFHVKLQGHTLYKDGSWNTLCLPFDVSPQGSSLAGATVMELDVDNKWKIDIEQWVIDNVNGTYQTGFDSNSGILYLYFKPTETIEAGKPYLIKWNNGQNIANPSFTNVTISSPATTTVTASNSGLNTVQFKGSYAPVTLTGNDASNLYLGADNNLYYPSADVTINSFRAYFHVDLSDGNGSQATVRAFVLNFGDEETTGVPPLTISPEGEKSEAFPREGLDGVFYTLDGRRLNGKPIAKGVYINNGKKIVVK